MSGYRLSEKDPGETVDLWFDFSGDLGTSTIVSVGTTVVTVDNVVSRGDDASPGAILQGVAFNVGSIVYQPVTAGLNGVDYHVTIKITTNDAPARVLFGELVLPVKNQ